MIGNEDVLATLKSMEMNAKAYARSVCREMTSGWKKKREKDFLSGEEGEKWAETWGREKEEKKEGEMFRPVYIVKRNKSQ